MSDIFAQVFMQCWRCGNVGRRVVYTCCLNYSLHGNVHWNQVRWTWRTLRNHHTRYFPPPSNSSTRCCFTSAGLFAGTRSSRKYTFRAVATSHFYQNQVLCLSEVLTTVRPLTCPGKMLSRSTYCKIVHEHFANQHHHVQEIHNNSLR